MRNDWVDCKLSEVVNIIGGGTPKRRIAECYGGDIPWLSVKDFNNDYRHVDKSDETIIVGTVRIGECEMIHRFKKDSLQFKKCPIRDYLEY